MRDSRTSTVTGTDGKEYPARREAEGKGEGEAPTTGTDEEPDVPRPEDDGARHRPAGAAGAESGRRGDLEGGAAEGPGPLPSQG